MKAKLNIGCGGIIAPGFHNVDIAFPEAQVGKLPKGTTYVQGALQDLPFEDDFADYAEAVDMIEHIPFRHLPKCFSEMYRVLKPGGTVCVATTNFDDVAKVWLNHSDEFTKLVTEGGDYTKMFDEAFVGSDWVISSEKIRQ